MTTDLAVMGALVVGVFAVLTLQLFMQGLVNFVASIVEVIKSWF